jgi:hypothetical protein
MKPHLVAAIALGTALLFQSGCTKAPPEQTKAVSEQTKPEQTKATRIKEIDAQLANWVSTGRPEDAGRRIALKAERALLAADLGYSTSTVTPVSAPVVAATPAGGAPAVVIAPASTQNRWEPMGGDSQWMDSNHQTSRHNDTLYPSSSSISFGGTNGTTTYRTNPRP